MERQLVSIVVIGTKRNYWSIPVLVYTSAGIKQDWYKTRKETAMLKTNRFKEKSGRQNHKLAELTSKVTVGSSAPTTAKLLMGELVTTEYERKRV